MPPIEIRSLTRSRVVPGRRRNDSAVALDEPVEKRALANVGPADDGHRQPVMDNAAARERSLKSGERRCDLADAPRDLGLWRHIDVIFGKIDASFKQCNQFHKRLLGRAQRGG